MKRKTTLYASKTGLEVYPVAVRRKRTREGAVGLRAFSMETKESVKMRMSPQEAFGLGLAIERMAERGEGKETFSYHRFTTKEGDFYSKLSLQGFRRNGKGYVAVVVERGKEKSKDGKVRINVPLSVNEALYLAHFLKQASYDQSWEEFIELEEEAEGEV